MSSTEIEEGNGSVERAKSDRAAKRNLFSRIALFIQQVIAELKKVVTPTREETVRYIWIVLGFVAVVMAIVFGLDFVFNFGANWVFSD